MYLLIIYYKKEANLTIINSQIVKTEKIELKIEKSPDLVNRIEKQSANKINDSLLFEIRDSDSKILFLNVVFQAVIKEKNESDQEDNEQQREKLEEDNFVSQFVKSSFNPLENDDKEHQEDKQENVEACEVLLDPIVLDNREFFRLADSRRMYNDTDKQYISKISSKKMFTEKELERNDFKIFDRESNQLAIKDTKVYFQTYNGNYMIPSTVREMLARYCFDAGLEYKETHALDIHTQFFSRSRNRPLICIVTT